MMKKQRDLGVSYFQTSPRHLSWNVAPIFVGVHSILSFPNATLTPKGIEHWKVTLLIWWWLFFFKIFLGHTSRTVTLTIFFLTMFGPLQWHLVVVSLLLVTKKFFPPGEKDGKNHPKLVICKWHIIGFGFSNSWEPQGILPKGQMGNLTKGYRWQSVFWIGPFYGIVLKASCVRTVWSEIRQRRNQPDSVCRLKHDQIAMGQSNHSLSGLIGDAVRQLGTNNGATMVS